jgi:hypothetical protein
MPDDALVSVVETIPYLRHSAGLLSEEERAAIADHLAAHPTDGDLVPGGGGIRKLRWGVAGRGKRGGVRVIHYFADRQYPVFILDVFAKNERENYTAAELSMVREVAKQLIETYRARRIK